MRSKQRTPFKIQVTAPSTGLNTRLSKLGSGALANYGAYSSSAAGMDSVVALRDATFATNVRFEDGVACNSPGFEAVTMTPAPDGPINLIGQANLSSQLASVSNRTPIIGTTASLYAQNGTNGDLLVFAGANQILYDATSATLAATFLDTFGAGTNVPAFLWTQSSGPSGAAITTPTTQSTTVTAMAPGKYVFTVTASDSGSSVNASVEITIYFGQNTSYQIPGFTSATTSVSCPSNGFVYVGNQDGPNGTVQVYDPATNAIVAVVTGFTTTPGGSGSYIGPVLYNPGDGYVYVIVTTANPTSFPAFVCRIDPNLNKIIVQTQLTTESLDQFNAVIVPGNILVWTATGPPGGSAHAGFVTFNLTTMTEGAFTQIATANPGYLLGLCYNTSNGLVYAPGVFNPGSAYNIYIYSFDPVALTITEVTTGLAGDSTVSASSIAYSPLDNSLYIGGVAYFSTLIRYNLTTATTSQIGSGDSFSLFFESNNQKIYFGRFDSVLANNFLCVYDPLTQNLTETTIIFQGNKHVGFEGGYTNTVSFSPAFNSIYMPSGNYLYVLNAP